MNIDRHNDFKTYSPPSTKTETKYSPPRVDTKYLTEKVPVTKSLSKSSEFLSTSSQSSSSSSSDDSDSDNDDKKAGESKDDQESINSDDSDEDDARALEDMIVGF